MTESVIYKDNLKLIISRPQKCSADYSVLFIHGGAWKNGTAELFLRNMEYFEQKGITSASVEYRTVTEGTTIDDCINDCEDAVLYLKRNAERLGIDANKIIAFGDSAGAHIAAVLGTPSMLKNKEAQVKMTVNCNAVCDLTGIWMNTVTWGKDIFDTYDKAYELSPVWHVSGNNSPQLIVHGLKDEAVLPQDSLKYYYELKKYGVKTDIIFLPEEKHAFILYDYYAADETVTKIMKEISGKIEKFLEI